MRLQLRLLSAQISMVKLFELLAKTSTGFFFVLFLVLVPISDRAVKFRPGNSHREINMLQVVMGAGMKRTGRKWFIRPGLTALISLVMASSKFQKLDTISTRTKELLSAILPKQRRWCL